MVQCLLGLSAVPPVHVSKGRPLQAQVLGSEEGDGHDGIWNLFREIGEKQERIEILDWYHLIENSTTITLCRALKETHTQPLSNVSDTI